MKASARWSAKRLSPGPNLSTAEHMLLALGVDPQLIETVFGDLAEERAVRVECDGVRLARIWYVLRSSTLSTPPARGCPAARRSARAGSYRDCSRGGHVDFSDDCGCDAAARRSTRTPRRRDWRLE